MHSSAQITGEALGVFWHHFTKPLVSHIPGFGDVPDAWVAV